ncbi:hypothetical protein FHS10_002998 [Mucilaginibacter dorajii]|nr:hypothetical protein [Mucilaginibacter dorajii]
MALFFLKQVFIVEKATCEYLTDSLLTLIMSLTIPFLSPNLSLRYPLRSFGDDITRETTFKKEAPMEPKPQQGIAINPGHLRSRKNYFQTPAESRVYSFFISELWLCRCLLSHI